MSLPYGPPQQVSPLIRGVRFGLLFAGIIYARIKQSRYSAMEEQYRKEQAAKKIIRDRELAKIKAKIDAEEREAVRQIETGEMFRTDTATVQSDASRTNGCQK